jgi:hypothetical protein
MYFEWLAWVTWRITPHCCCCFHFARLVQPIQRACDILVDDIIHDQHEWNNGMVAEGQLLNFRTNGRGGRSSSLMKKQMLQR